jgi:hypothetical protein
MREDLYLGGMWTRRALFLAAVVSLSSCGDPNPTPDAGGLPDAPTPLDAAPECTENLDCDDAISCNGTETCQAGRCVRGVPMRCDDGIACTNDFCSEELRGCVNRPADVDRDGHADAACVDARGMAFGDDCDDMQAMVYPGALEVCDAMGRDEDCDPMTFGGIDFDGDDFEDVRCCNGTACGTDCNDAVAGANPTGTEVCNGIDDNCDGMIDEGVRSMGFVDLDGDGRGGTTPMMGCGNQTGFSLYGDDCNDNPEANGRLQSPLLAEICDLIDNDCDGVPDPADSAMAAVWYLDADGDGFGDRTRTTLSCAVPSGSYVLLATDCDDTRVAVHPGQAEQCNGIDDDCNGSADYALAPGDLEDDDRDGLPDARCLPASPTPDCDDRDPSSVPGGTEGCDGRDNDCDGRTDEDVSTNTYYIDRDGDGYGSLGAAPITGCLPIAGYVTRAGDCDDTSAVRYPTAEERCNGGDEDCDLAVDEAPAAALCSASSGMMQICSSGVCVTPGCIAGYADCSGAPAPDCETNITTSAVNCGACGRVCPNEPNASALCMGGTCGLSPCATGTRDCNMNLGMGGDGCETSVLTDPNNCGACGSTCAVAPNRSATCTMGVCGMTSTCNVGFADCNALAPDGCEINTRNDARNCGTCGNNCLRRPGTVATCGAGMCSAPTCIAGFTDCNGDLASPTGDGCENPSATCPRVTWHNVWGTPFNDSTNANTDVVVDAAGNIYATYFVGSTINDPRDLPYTGGRFGSLIVSFTPSGAHRWTQRFGTAATMGGDFTAQRIAIHPTTGDLIVGGTGWGSPGWVGFGYPGAVNVGTQTGNATPFVVRLSAATGAYVWGQTFPMLTGPGRGHCDGMTVSGDNIYITGRFDASFTIGTTTLTSAGLSDVYVARLNGSGVVQNAFRFGSNAANEWSNAIAIASNGDVLIGGGYDSGSADIGGRPLVNLGSADGFYARFPATGGTSISAARITSALATDHQEVLDVRAGTMGRWYISGRYDSQALIGTETLAGSGTAPFLAAVRDSDGSIAWAIGTTTSNGSFAGLRRFHVGPGEELRGLFNANYTPVARFGGVAFMPGPDGPAVNGFSGPQIPYVNGATGVVNRIESVVTGGSLTSSGIAIAADGHNVVVGFTAGASAGPASFMTRGDNDHFMLMTGF